MYVLRNARHASPTKNHGAIPKKDVIGSPSVIMQIVASCNIKTKPEQVGRGKFVPKPKQKIDS